MNLLRQAEKDCELPAEEIGRRLLEGSRCVRYSVCVSFVLGTLQSETRIMLCSSPNWQYISAIPASVASMLLGWWALPWGPLLTFRCLWVNLSGGNDLTEQVFREYSQQSRENPR